MLDGILRELKVLQAVKNFGIFGVKQCSAKDIAAFIRLWYEDGETVEDQEVEAALQHLLQLGFLVRVKVNMFNDISVRWLCSLTQFSFWVLWMHKHKIRYSDLVCTTVSILLNGCNQREVIRFIVYFVSLEGSTWH